MSTKKNILTDKKRKAQLKLLKAAGIINYDLRKKLTSGQKANATRKYREFRNVLEPTLSRSTDRRKEYVVRTVSPKVAEEIKKGGYKVYGNKVWISLDRYKTVKIKSKKDSKGNVRVELVRETSGKKSVEKLYYKSGNIFDDIQEAIKMKTLDNGLFVSVKIGSAENFTVNMPVDNFEDLLNYLEKWTPKDDPRQRDYLLSKMTLVYIDVGF